MKRLIILTIFLILSLKNYSQVWKPINNKLQSKYIVYITQNKEEATMLGFKVDNEWQATRWGLIYLVPIWWSRGTNVYFTDNKSEADIILFWTKNKSDVK